MTTREMVTGDEARFILRMRELREAGDPRYDAAVAFLAAACAADDAMLPRLRAMDDRGKS